MSRLLNRSAGTETTSTCDCSAASGEHVLVPDLAGWRHARMPVVPNVPYFELAPDWLCEVLSPSTEARDRTDKLEIYAAAGVAWVWLLHPTRETLEIFRLHEGSWVLDAGHRGDAKVRARPFDAIELALADLWLRAAQAPPVEPGPEKGTDSARSR